MTPRPEGLFEIVHDRSALQSQGLRCRQDSFDKSAAGDGMRSLAGLAPDHRRTEHAFGVVVGRLDAFHAGKGPHRRFQTQQRLKEPRRPLESATLPAFEQLRHLSAHESDSSPRLRATVLAAGKLVPPFLGKVSLLFRRCCHCSAGKS